MMADGDDAEPLMTTGFLRLIGAENRAIAGPVTRRGQQGWIEVLAWSHTVTSPRDAASGIAAGRHHPVVISKSIDDASPRLMEAALHDEVMSEWVLELEFSPETRREPLQPSAADFLHLEDRDQALREYITALERHRLRTDVALRVELEAARLARIETVMLDTTDPAHAVLPPRERLLFDYRRIRWTWGADGLSVAADNPATPTPGGPAEAPPPAAEPAGVHVQLNIAGNEAQAEITVKGDKGALLPGFEVTGFFRSENTGDTGVSATGRTNALGKVTLIPRSFSMPAGSRRWFEFRLDQPDLLAGKWTRVGRFVTKSVEFPP